MSKEAAAVENNGQFLSKEDFKNAILADYKLANISRETSLLGRREVLTGKAKFGIFGDGKEIPQLAMAIPASGQRPIGIREPAAEYGWRATTASSKTTTWKASIWA